MPDTPVIELGGPTTHILDVGETGRYRGFPNYVSAVLAAYDSALKGTAATVVQVDDVPEGLKFTPLCTVAPPTTPPPTSPEAPHE